PPLRPGAPGRPAPAGAGRSVRLGIMPGVGRGPPGRAPGAPAPGRGAPGRGAPGRGPPAPAGGRGPPWPAGAPERMPCWEANGLLPGRGPPGRLPWRAAGRGPPGPESLPRIPCCEENGLLPGRGAPGLADVGRGAAGFSAAGFGAAGLSAAGFGVAGASGAAGAGVDSAAGFGAADAPGRGASEAGAAGAAGAGVAGLLPGLAAAGALAADCWGKAPRSFLTTGASMVEEAERTNSPISCSFATASFEVMPSSLASSCTRTLATFLLSRSAPALTSYRVRTVFFGLGRQPPRSGMPIVAHN